MSQVAAFHLGKIVTEANPPCKKNTFILRGRIKGKYDKPVMEPILISACLLGTKCNYKGGDSRLDYIEELNQYFDLVPFCPEVEGGLPIPRDPSEIRGSFVVQKTSRGEVDVTHAFREGARKAVSVASYLGIRYAILTERSPSCGSHQVHDGYFRNRLIQGQGITAAALSHAGVTVMNEEEGRAFLEEFKKNDEARALASAKARAMDEKKNEPRSEPKPEHKKPFPKKPYGKDFKGEKKSYRKDRDGEQKPRKFNAKPNKGKPGWSFQGKTRPFAGKGKKTDR